MAVSGSGARRGGGVCRHCAATAAAWSSTDFSLQSRTDTIAAGAKGAGRPWVQHVALLWRHLLHPLAPRHQWDGAHHRPISSSTTSNGGAQIFPSPANLAANSHCPATRSKTSSVRSAGSRSQSHATCPRA